MFELVEKLQTDELVSNPVPVLKKKMVKVVMVALMLWVASIGE